MEAVIVGIVAIALGALIGYLIRNSVGTSNASSAESKAQRLVLEAEREAERLTREALVEAKDEIVGLRREAEEDLRVRRDEIQRQEERLAQKERSIDAKLDEVEKRHGEDRKSVV